MGWDGPQGKPPQAVSTAEPSVSAKPKRPAGRMPAACRGLRGENAARFRLASYHTAGQNARKAGPITENRLSCMETVPEESKFS